MKHETDQVKEQLGAAVGDLGQRIDKAERRLDGLADEVTQIDDQRLAAMATEESSEKPTGSLAGRSLGRSYAEALAAPIMTTRSPEKRREESYWRCRRALRLRPIPEGNANVQVEKFMKDHLGLSEFFLQSVGPFTVQRVPYGPAARIKAEAVVTFQTTDVRDAVKGAARNLAGKGQDYGVRLELPNHLKSAMKALQAVSYELKTKYPQARRNVLFDDEALDLVLDFCLGEDRPWRRMTSAQAVQRKKKKPVSDSRGKQALEEGEIDALLGDDDGAVVDGGSDEERPGGRH